MNLKFCTSRLFMKMLSFLFVREWTMAHIIYSSFGIPFPVKTPVMGRSHQKTISDNFLRGGEWGKKNSDGRANF